MWPCTKYTPVKTVRLCIITHSLFILVVLIRRCFIVISNFLKLFKSYIFNTLVQYRPIAISFYYMLSNFYFTVCFKQCKTTILFKRFSRLRIDEAVKVEKMKDVTNNEIPCNLHPGSWRPTDTNLWVYTVPRYADNHNPMLPLSLQQRLDGMSPQEYLIYVLNELTLEERESLMIDERQRRKSFLVGWPHIGELSGINMAQAGFYSVDNYDRVQCVFCRGCLHQWDPDDNPMAEHRKSFTFCRFVKGLSCGNREYRSSKLTKEDLRNITQFYKPTNTNFSVESDCGHLGISTNRAATVSYAPDSTRLRTFSRWPASAPIAAQRMCDAGFYYTGFDDQVCCFFCDGGIKGWAAADDPWEEHTRWFPDCAYLIQKKGLAYIDQVHAKTPANKKCVRQTQSQRNKEIEVVQTKSELEDMQMICQDLGHDPMIIQNAIESSSQPITNIKDLIDAIYLLEEEGYANSRQGLNIQDSLITAHQMICPEEDAQKIQGQDKETSLPASRNSNCNRYKRGCRRCELKIDIFVPATHVGLPCGHLIFCSSCNEKENKRCSNSTDAVRCPFNECDAVLTGSIRVFLA